MLVNMMDTKFMNVNISVFLLLLLLCWIADFHNKIVKIRIDINSLWSAIFPCRCCRSVPFRSYMVLCAIVTNTILNLLLGHNFFAEPEPEQHSKHIIKLASVYNVLEQCFRYFST